MFETSCNFSTKKIASSCRDKNRLCKRALSMSCTVPLKSKLPPLVSFLTDGSRFLQDGSRFSRESLKDLVWHMLHVRNRLCVTIVVLQFTGKLMGPSNRLKIHVCIDALIVSSIHIKQTSNVRSDIIRH